MKNAVVTRYSIDYSDTLSTENCLPSRVAIYKGGCSSSSTRAAHHVHIYHGWIAIVCADPLSFLACLAPILLYYRNSRINPSFRFMWLMTRDILCTSKIIAAVSFLSTGKLPATHSPRTPARPTLPSLRSLGLRGSKPLPLAARSCHTHEPTLSRCTQTGARSQPGSSRQTTGSSASRKVAGKEEAI